MEHEPLLANGGCRLLCLSRSWLSAYSIDPAQAHVDCNMAVQTLSESYNKLPLSKTLLYRPGLVDVDCKDQTRVVMCFCAKKIRFFTRQKCFSLNEPKNEEEMHKRYGCAHSTLLLSASGSRTFLSGGRPWREIGTHAHTNKPEASCW